MAAKAKSVAKKKLAPAKKSRNGSTKAAPRSGAANYAWKSMLVMGQDVDDPRFTTPEDGNHAQFLFDGVPYAVMRLDGDQLEIDLRAPADLEPHANVLHLYERLTEPRGWLRIRNAAARDPRPWLACGFGTLIGSTRRDLRLAADGATRSRRG